MQVTVVHNALHCVADGILQSDHTLKYSLDSEQGAFANTRIMVHGPIRVTSVTGHGVLSWKVSPSPSGDGSCQPSTCVDVAFRSSLISDTLILLMTTEIELDSEIVSLPIVRCEGVLRQTGSFGIVKAANAEVHEFECKGVARVGAEDLPEELRYQTNLPIMFAYTHRSPDFAVRLSIAKHEQVGVQEAIAESVFYQALVVDTHTMHHLILVLQNSNQQYLELQGLPPDARLWSLMVNSQPAKPVKGKDNALLIPLLVGTASDSNQGMQKTSIEVTFLSQQSPLGESGTFNVAPPRLNVPISTFLMEVQFPEAYQVDFAGPLRKVVRFSYPLPQPVNHSRGTDIVPRDFNFTAMAQDVKRTGVSVKVPKAGQRHLFERLLVVDNGASMAAHYETPPQPADATHCGPLARLRSLLTCERRRAGQ